jgi:hypothetical protein
MLQLKYYLSVEEMMNDLRCGVLTSTGCSLLLVGFFLRQAFRTLRALAGRGRILIYDIITFAIRDVVFAVVGYRSICPQVYLFASWMIRHIDSRTMSTVILFVKWKSASVALEDKVVSDKKWC